MRALQTEMEKLRGGATEIRLVLVERRAMVRHLERLQGLLKEAEQKRAEGSEGKADEEEEDEEEEEEEDEE